MDSHVVCLYRALYLCTATCWPVNKRVPFMTLYQWALSQLQASYVHLHPIIEGEDGGGAGAVGPLFHIADGLIEVFPTGQASGRQAGGS